MQRTLVCFLVLLSLLPLCGQVRCAEISEIRRLRTERLYRAAETACVQGLNESNLPESEAALLTVELLRTYAGMALDSRSEQRNKVWPRGENYAAQFDRRFSKSPFAAIVHLQLGVLLNLRAKIERIENEVRGELANATSRKASRSAIRSLQDTLKEIGGIRPSSSGKTGLRSSQLAQLRHKTQRELGLAYEHYSQCFASGSADQISALTQAVEYFETLSRLRAFPETAAECQLFLARCHRRLGNFDLADNLLSHLESEPSASTQSEMAVATERAHYYLDRNDLDRGLRSCETAYPLTDVDNTTNAEYELAKLRALTMICKKRNEPQQSPRSPAGEADCRRNWTTIFVVLEGSSG